VTPVASPARAKAGVLLAVLLVLALPLLLATLTVGMGGLPHDAGLQAARAHDVSLAALHRADRFLHGDLRVALAPALLVATLDAVLDAAPPPDPRPAAVAGGAAPVATASAGRVAAETALRL
jgi:hypothetical protein